VDEASLEEKRGHRGRRSTKSRFHVREAVVEPPLNRIFELERAPVGRGDFLQVACRIVAVGRQPGVLVKA